MISYNPRARLGKKREVLEPPSNFSLCAEHKVTVTLDDETKELLRDINSALQKLTGANKPTSQIIKEALLEPLSEPGSREEIEEPAELSVNIPEALRKPVKIGHIVPGPKWNYATNVRWREEGNVLILRYKSGEVETDWETVKRLSQMDERNRLLAIRDILGADFTSQRRTAYNQSAIRFAIGEIKQPVNPDKELDVMYSTFREEVDPDKPMLAGLNLTQVKKGCGEGVEC